MSDNAGLPAAAPGAAAGTGYDLARDAAALSGRQNPPRTVHIVIVDADPQAVALVESALAGAPFEPEIEVIPSAALGRERLHAEEPDVMEAIGRLAGGIAHNFNNLLTAIVGNADLIAERLDPAGPAAREMAEIRKAADSAAALTQQLLSFSRKQYLNPRVLDLNATAAGLLPMLRGLVGGSIQTSAALADNLSRVTADSGQIEQTLINLALNARDAMPFGGDLTIETDNVSLDRDRMSIENLTLEPGDYVMLAVTDTGSGMDAETRARAFEPFFTTKPKSLGIGLGLAAVYGIVHQSEGGVSITTAPGCGTSIRIYLPVTTAIAEAPQGPPVPLLSDSSGAETILLVEDNDAVRDLAVKALRRRGYTVVEARNAEEALEWAMSSGIKPQMLLTDVVMPGLSGPNLAARLLQQNAELRLLFMSGYTDDALDLRSTSWDVPILHKPFTPAQLAAQVRRALDTTDPE